MLRVDSSSSTNRGHYVCLNCQQNMKFDESLLRMSRKTPEPNPMEAGSSRNLMQIIENAETPAEAPICKQCSDALLVGLTEQQSALDSECFDLGSLIRDLQQHHTNSDVSAVKQQLANLKADEEQLRSELADLAKSDCREEADLIQKKKELEQTTKREKELWGQFRDTHKKLLECDDAIRQHDAELRYAEGQIKKLTSRNVLDLCFHIWVEGPLAQINGFKLGRLPDHPVEWSEINSAWGQAALLLDVLLQLTQNQPSMYKIMTLGSHSYIKMTKPSGETKDLPLHASGGWRPFGTGHNTDEGAVAFLECLAILQSALINKDPTWVLPHSISKDCLVHNSMKYSVKMQFNSEERWTRAMKCLLSNLKYALTMVDMLRKSQKRQ